MKTVLFIIAVVAALTLITNLEKSVFIKNTDPKNGNTNTANINIGSNDIPKSSKEKNIHLQENVTHRLNPSLEKTTQEQNEITVQPEAQATIAFSAFENYEAKRVLENRGLIPPIISNEIYLQVGTKLSDFKPGDIYRLEALSLGLQHEIKIERVKTRENGINTMYGSTEIDGERYAALFTSSENAIYGEIEHPDGTFLIEGTGQHIWMAKRKDMAKNVVEDKSEELDQALKERAEQRKAEEAEIHEMI